MKIRTSAPRVNHAARLIVAADVSRDELHLFSRFDRPAATPGAGPLSVTLEDVVPNRTPAIEASLGGVAALAREHAFASVEVLCESSGGFERPLLAVARRLGMATALVSPERVKDLKRVESLDTGKTDRKDARVIHLAGSMGKTQRHRVLPERYELLRRLTAFHDDEAVTVSALRTRLAYTLREAFPDYDRPVSFTYSRTGRVLLAEGLLDPYRIVRLGEARLAAMIRRRVPGVKNVTIERLMKAARASVRSAPPEPVVVVLVARLAALIRQIEDHEAARDGYQAEIERIGQELKADGELPAIDEAVSGISLFNVARIVGQTGPLADFQTSRQLLRYGGLNLRERESGTYRGKTRLSKKGRPLLRKVLGQAVFPVLRGDCLMGEGYAERRKRMPEQKAKVAAMRKLLVVIWAVHRSGEAFDAERVFACESQYAASPTRSLRPAA